MVLESAEGDASVVEVHLPIPPGARSVSIEPSGSIDRENERMVTEVRVGSTPRRIEARWSGGLSIEPPLVDLQPGQASTGLRILDFRYVDGTWYLDLEGPAGRVLNLRLHGEPFSKAEGARLLGREGNASTLAVEFGGTEGRATKRVRIER